jgi:ABC-type Mn2+/Zn2+ transport system ATPase subunit
MSALIAFQGVDLGYGRKRILTNIDFDVVSGDFLGIIGPNGAGKTTLLKAILGLLKPLSGQIVLSSEELRIGYVPQRDSVDTLFPLTVLDIVLMGRYSRLSALGRPGQHDRERAMEALNHVDIVNLAHRHFPSLSGGQKQRALIARALVGEPNLLILDEPTNGMDLTSEKAIMDLVRQLHDQDGMTVLMVSHLLNTVINYVKRIAIIGGGGLREGEIEEMATSGSLTQLYGVPVQVIETNGRRVAMPIETGGSSNSKAKATEAVK